MDTANARCGRCPMSIWAKTRQRIVSPSQHPLKHTLSEMPYTHVGMPGVTQVESALNYLTAVLYPRSQATVATPGDLPAVGNTLLDYRVVTDDGDGKAASYRWEQREGDVAAKWYKIFDMDWGSDSVLSNFLLKTQDQYTYKYGIDDLDDTGVALAGIDAGQHLYGGQSASANLTLHANAGDGVGAQTGFVQFTDSFRPYDDNLRDIGDATHRVKDIYLSGSLGNATNSYTVANIKTAYDHTSATGNPHSTAYSDLGTPIGTVTVDGDCSGSVDLSTGGNKTLTITVSDDSHAHVWGDIDNADTSVYTKAKAIFQDGGGITWTKTDLSETITATVSSGVPAAAANKIIGANDDGTGWIAVSGNIALTGEVTGNANFDDATGGWSIATTVTSGSIAIDELTDVDTSANLDIGDYLVWNGTNWVPTSVGNQIAHDLLSGLGDDDHTQYALLLGRAGGQTIQGGTLASQNLTLDSTFHATKGDILITSSLKPTADAVYSGGWSGTDIGDSSHRLNNIYSAGEFIGIRPENKTSGTLPASSANNKGRFVWSTDDDTLYIDNGSAYVAYGSGGATKFTSDTAWNGTDLTKDVDVSSVITDARTAIWQLCDNTNDFDRIYCSIKATSASNVRITVGTALPAGSYRLIGIE